LIPFQHTVAVTIGIASFQDFCSSSQQSIMQIAAEKTFAIIFMISRINRHPPKIMGCHFQQPPSKNHRAAMHDLRLSNSTKVQLKHFRDYKTVLSLHIFPNTHKAVTHLRSLRASDHRCHAIFVFALT
jgi:hypothetical protein